MTLSRPAVFWREVLDGVRSYRLGAVELTSVSLGAMPYVRLSRQTAKSTGKPGAASLDPRPRRNPR